MAVTFWGRQLPQLLVGLVLYGVTMGFMVEAGLGLDPWDVFHQGVAERSGLSFGIVVNLTGAVVLLLWLPLRQRPGLGTVLNILLIGTSADLALSALPTPDELAVQIAFLLVGVFGNGLAGALYVGARLGPGPRDGLWVALVARTGISVGRWRTAIEATVLALGWLLGGTVGIGTVLYAVAIGPTVQYFLPRVGLAAQQGGDRPEGGTHRGRRDLDDGAQEGLLRR